MAGQENPVLRRARADRTRDGPLLGHAGDSDIPGKISDEFREQLADGHFGNARSHKLLARAFRDRLTAPVPGV